MIDTIVVTGICAPERRALANRLAAEEDRDLVAAHGIEGCHDPLGEGASLCRWSGPAGRCVVELPAGVDPREIDLVFGATDDVRLSASVTVVDAAHFRRDLFDISYLAAPGAGFGGHVRPVFISRAVQLVRQIEAASAIHVVNTGPEELPQVLTILRTLNPGAELHVPGKRRERALPESDGRRTPGWLRALGDAPHAAQDLDDGVSWFRYRQLRPFHPARLDELLHTRWDTGEFGCLLRSAGWLHIASRPGRLGTWDHVGSVCSLQPAAPGLTRSALVEQDLAVLTEGVDARALRLALDDAALTDEELLAGPRAWQDYHDPLPAWSRW